MSFSVIIPSRNIDNLVACVKAVREHEPRVPVIVVDDGIEGWSDRIDVLRIGGIKPFVFARNCNLGIMDAFGHRHGEQQHPDGNWVVWGTHDLANSCDGVILLNDDALLTTPGGFTALAAVAADHPEYGVIAAACDNTGNPNQRPKGIGLREDPRMVCFVCVYIPRRTIEKVGLLDERYVGYGMDDDDYCFSVRKAGLKVGIFDHCIVDHRSLTSSYRGNPRAPSDFRPNMKLFIDKWGTDNWNRPAKDALRHWGF